MIQYSIIEHGEIAIESVKLADADNAVYAPSGGDIAPRGSGLRVQVGNVLWRSPEAQVGIGINKATDVWSFGLVVSARRNLSESVSWDQL